MFSGPRDVPSQFIENVNLFHQAEERLRNRDLTSALDLYREAEASGYDPDACAGARWICHMLGGDYESAWRESDAIAKRGHPDPNRFWSRRPLAGRRVLIRCLHGLGDTLQYVRYVPLLREFATSVTLEAQPPLKELLATAGIADHVMTWGEPEPPWDEQIEIVELPLLFRSTLANLPANVPYLRIGQEVGKLAARLRIGLLWASSAFNPERSIPLHLLEDLFTERTAQFFSFQPDPARAELLNSEYPVEDCSPPDADVLVTARRLRSMDLIITVDTMLAHLAGALGLRVWLLLPFAADWRWMMDRRDSPWYPTMRLFRQPEPGDWRAVVRAVQWELVPILSRWDRNETESQAEAFAANFWDPPRF